MRRATLRAARRASKHQPAHLGVVPALRHGARPARHGARRGAATAEHRQHEHRRGQRGIRRPRPTYEAAAIRGLRRPRALRRPAAEERIRRRASCGGRARSLRQRHRRCSARFCLRAEAPMCEGCGRRACDRGARSLLAGAPDPEETSDQDVDETTCNAINRHGGSSPTSATPTVGSLR